MKIDSNIQGNLPLENFEGPQEKKAPAPSFQGGGEQIVPFNDSQDGPIGTIQQGLHSENADNTNKDSWSDWQTGEAALWGASALTGTAAFGLLGIDFGFASDIGNFVDHVFDGVGGVFD